MERAIDNCLAKLRTWAHSKVAGGQEPPWAWYQYMKLIETVDAIQDGRKRVKPLAAQAPQPRGARPEAHGPRAGDVVEIDKPPRRRRKRDDLPPLPM